MFSLNAVFPRKEDYTMKRTFLAIILLLIMSLIVMACSDNNEINNGDLSENNGSSEKNQENETDDEQDSVEENQNIKESEEYKANEEEKLSIRELSDQIIDALDKRDMKFISQYVHPVKGLLFSPYAYLADEAVVIEKEAVSTMLDSNEAFDWGLYDGIGTPIELTPPEYFDEFLNMTPYQQADQILVDDIQKRGNTINNIREKFPDAEIIEYFQEGSEEYAGMDWSSVLLVYEHDETSGLQLVAVVRDMWTI